MTGPISPVPTGANPHRGIATLEFGGKVLRFRTNPNEVWWNYHLNTAVENTYGGRVVQILGAKVDDLVIKVDCGRGGWPYQRQIIAFIRDMISEQRKGDPGIFTYTTRNWRLKVFALSVPFTDSVANVVREIELRFKVQEDVSGVMTGLALSSEIARLKDGIGFKKGQYNTSNPDNVQRQAPSGTQIGPGNVLSAIQNFGGMLGNIASLIPQ